MSNIRVFDPTESEYKKLQTAVAMLNTFSDKAVYRMGVIYFDFGQNWLWTTIIVDKGDGGYQIYPSQQKAIVEAETMDELAEACKALLVS